MKKLLSGLLVLCAGAIAAPTRADDDSIFMQGSAIPPNVVILIDTSGSMNDRIGGVRKIDTAKAVVTQLLQAVDTTRFGIFSFNTTSDGAHLVASIGTAKATMISAVAALTARGSTPLGRSLIDVEDYFDNPPTGDLACTDGSSNDSTSNNSTSNNSTSNNSTSNNSTSNNSTSNNSTSNNSSSNNSSRSGGSTAGGCTPDLFEFECQKSYVIVVTDGLPTGEPENLVADTASILYGTDYSTLPGKQNVIVHTIGFDIPEGAALLRQTATNGGGTFYTASTAVELQNALQNAMGLIMTDTHSFSTPMIPASTAAGGTYAYMASFYPAPTRPFWLGFVRAYQRNSDGRVRVTAEGVADKAYMVWDAADLLAGRAASTRTLYTATGGTLQAFLRSNANVTQALLGASSSTERNNIIDFIRGIDTADLDLDGNVTEERSAKLGDIYHSAPVLVFPPPLVSSDSSYTAFKEATKNRAVVLLVGANDGALHAFRASDGYELWAFIPPNVLPTLKSLMSRVGSHPYYVDSSPIVADVKIGGTWKTVAVFGERRGGTSYYALDITNTAAPAYLWSFTDSGMGETWSEPAIGKIKLADGTEKYVAFVGGGYDTASNNTLGKAFYAIDLANGQALWKYANTGTGDSAQMNFSLAATPTAVDLNGDQFIDRVYIADVGGQLWKFDVSAGATLSGGLVNNWTGKRLFAAAPSQTNPPASGEYYPSQGVYAAPALAYDAMGALWVYFGTGDRNHPLAVSSNRFYGIMDNTTMTNGSALTEASLTDAESSASVTQGWYYELKNDEKVFEAADVFNSTVYFTTYTPYMADACALPIGTARLYALNPGNGHAAWDWSDDEPYTSTDGSENRSTVVGGGAPGGPDIILGTTTDGIVVGTSDEEISTTEMPSTVGKRIRYWREVF